MKTSQIILDKINKEKIKPKAKWYFVAEHIALWIPGVLITFIGAVSVAGILYAVTHTGWDLREFIYPTKTDFILAILPSVWIIAFVFFGSIIVKALRATHDGYRFSIKTMLIGSVMTSFVLGVFIFFMDDTLQADSIIRYPVRMREQQVWSSVQNGRLAGFVEEIKDETLMVRDKDDIVWAIDISSLGSTTLPFIGKGESVRFIGTSTDDHVFVACAISPWGIGEFHRSPINKGNHLRPDIKRNQNNNPDCKSLLENIKKNVRDKVKEKKK